MTKIPKTLLKSIFFISTLILLYAYAILLNEKIQRPEFKNLQTKGIIFLGVVILFLVFLNLKYVFNVFKTRNKKSIE